MKSTGRRVLTNCRQQTEGLVRTRKEFDEQRRTYNLATAKEGTCQDTEKKDSIANERGALTCWRRHRKRLVRKRKESDQERRTHCLETAEGGPCQDRDRDRRTEGTYKLGKWEGLVRKRNRPSKAHSLPGDGRGTDLSEHEKNPTERGRLTSWRRQRQGPVRTRKESDQARCTHFLETAEKRPIRTRKEIHEQRRTHVLETVDGGIVRTRKKTGRASHTHQLETAK